MWTLLKKEFRLCLHPAAVIFCFFGLMIVIPNYPYEVMFFFSSLGMFFICLTARENDDLIFTAQLPVKKEDVAVARVLMCVILQVVQLLFAGVVATLKYTLFPLENYAGFHAGFAFFGFGMLMLGVIDLIFFTGYFKNPSKVGVPFLTSSVFAFLYITVLIVLKYTVPVFMVLDTIGLDALAEKLIVFFVGSVLYGGLVAVTCRLSAKSFAKYDL